MATGVFATLAHYRLTTYAVVSSGLLLGVVFRAVQKHSNFYSIAVDLSRNSRSVLVLANFGLLISLLVGRVFQQIFFGTLRANELERLYDRVWFFLTESLLAWTIFRDELDTNFGIMFGFLLFAKCFHWLLADRIEWMDQVPHPGPNSLFHIRVNALFFILWLTDLLMLSFALESILGSGMSGVILFASEYSILLATIFNCALKYYILLYDIRRAARLGGETAPPWEDKSMFIFYVELATDFLKLITYLVFFCLVLAFYGLPLNIIRDVFLTARSFIGRLRDLVRYRAATRNMDTRYPNATLEEMQAMNDKTCIICREEMIIRGATDQPIATNDQGQPPNPPVTNEPRAPALAANSEPNRTGPNDTPKMLPCGHVFHFHCLRSWLERQQSCPTCRRSVLEDNRRPAARGAPNANGQAANGRQPAQPQAAHNGAGARGQRQRADVAHLHQQLARLEQLLQQQQQHNNLVPNQLRYGPPPVWPGHHQVPNAEGVPDVIPLGPARAQGTEQPQPATPRTGDASAQAPTNAPESGAATTPAAASPPTPAAASPPTPATASPPTPAATEPSSSVHSAEPASGVTAPTPTTPTPSAARPAQVPDSARRNQAYEAAVRRLGINSQQSQPGPSTGVSNLSSQTNTPHAQPSHVAAHGGGSLLSGATRRTRTTSILAGRSASPAPRSGSPLASITSTAPAQASPVSTPHIVGRGPSPVPGVIPLYDPTYAHIPGHPLLSFQQGLEPSYGGVPQAQFVRAPLSTFGFTPAFRGVAAELGGLPPRLSDEQLTRLDLLTREAIDERLRVLDNVQGTLQRCTEELLKARSVLPPFKDPPPRESDSSAVMDSIVSSSSAAVARVEDSSSHESDASVVADSTIASSSSVATSSNSTVPDVLKPRRASFSRVYEMWKEEIDPPDEESDS